jgi:flagellar motility protein MotE (MotC chaperone)
MNLRIVTRHLRLLPAVMIAGTVLLFLKGAGLIHDARAEGQSKVQTASALAVPHAEPIARKDPASDDTETASAAEVDVLSSLTRRRTELDARGRDLDMRANVLAATEKRIDAKITALKQLQLQINQMMGQRDAAQEKQIVSLVKTYSAMKPKDAARIFNGLDENVLLEVAQAMKSDALAPVLAGMNAETAQKLTLRLASRLNVPEKAILTPPPQQAAALAPAETQLPPSPAPTPAAIQPPPSPAPAATKAAALPAPAPQATAPQAAAPQAAPPPAKHG